MVSTKNNLTKREVADLLDAIDDEYKARATYHQVIADFGDLRPFVNIVQAEQRHIDALVVLFERYGVPVPEDPWPSRVPRYGSLAEACRAGVEAEVENAALYDRVLEGTRRPDVLTVYRNLQRASQENHLPAFRRCVERRGMGVGPGGRGRGPGPRRTGGV